MSNVPPTATEALTRARELGPLLRGQAAEAERLRRLPDPVVAALTDAGLFRLSVPPEFGGSRLPLSEQLAIIEEVSRHDGSAGWCVMIHSTTSVLCGQLTDEVLAEMFGRDRAASACGVYAPRGRAVEVDGGLRVSGRWSFASGCEHSAWRLGGAFIFDGAQPRLDARGQPLLRLAIFAAADTRVLDTWHVSGLRGTGSHDLEVENAFVPAGRVVDPAAEPLRPGTLYRMPLFGFLAAEVAAVSLGIGRASIETFAELATDKKPVGGKRTLAQRGTIQLAVADAEAELRAARAYLLDVVGACESALHRGVPIALEARAQLRLAASHAVRATTRVVDKMYEAGGGTSLYETSPLQRYFRDAHVATQHVMVAEGIRELVGRHLLGEPVPPAML